MARVVPPLPAPDVNPVTVTAEGSTMSPTWRQFWVNLLLYIGGAANGLNLQASASYANDAAAAAGGVPVGGFYRNGSQVMVRIV